MRTWVVLGLAAALGGAACSSGFDGVSAKDGCGDIWASVCTRYYECYRADEIAEIGLPPTAAGCTTAAGYLLAPPGPASDPSPLRRSRP